MRHFKVCCRNPFSLFEFVYVIKSPNSKQTLTPECLSLRGKRITAFPFEGMVNAIHLLEYILHGVTVSHIQVKAFLKFTIFICK